MSKLQRIKVMLSELLELEMGSATTDKGIIYWDEETLEVGAEVYVKDENDVKVPAEDGDYEFDGKVVTVSDGKVTEIVDKVEPIEEPEEESTEEQQPDEAEQAEDEKAEEETAEESTEEVVKPAEEPELDYVKEIAELREMIESLKKEVEELKGKPLAMSATAQFDAMQKKVTKGVARYADAIAELRKK